MSPVTAVVVGLLLASAAVLGIVLLLSEGWEEEGPDA